MSASDYINVWHRTGLLGQLETLWADGLSFSEIALRLNRSFMGVELTRNAVCGKLSRMGFKRGPAYQPNASTRKPRAKSAKPRQPRPFGVVTPESGHHTRAVVVQARLAGAQLPPARKTRVPPAEIAVAPRVWTAHQPRECCWPIEVEGEELHSCCNPTDGRQYCAPHYSIAYRPSVNKPEPEEIVRRRAA